jgi:hypothetical protein
MIKSSAKTQLNIQIYWEYYEIVLENRILHCAVDI